MTAVAAALHKMRGAGFSVAVVAGRLRVSPADRLSATQRQWLAANSAGLLAELVTNVGHVADIVAMFGAEVIRVTPEQEPATITTRVVGLPEPDLTDAVGCYPVWVAPVMAGTVRCADCHHGSRALPGDEDGAWRLCLAGQGGRFALARHRCTMFKVAV